MSGSIFITGPIGGKSGSTSSVFTISTDGQVSVGTTATLSDGGVGGTFSTISSSTFPFTTTYTPPSGTEQRISINVTNNGTASNPNPWTYTAINVASGGIFKVFKNLF